ncbi:PREDICTED: leucine-rich repeat-containing protein 27 [Elephantulus edwardii]|uniref:leucine-rich repeat-containing protein 27 n=1 Tax=Elephantulus edwardii TaxID=28737 RepID=UPI0003F0A487|nr:PREDICTED: leucine-rich repeat-containing protein 27 [Elephantulus edwardii]
MEGSSTHQVPHQAADDLDDGTGTLKAKPASSSQDTHIVATRKIMVSPLTVLDLSHSGLCHLDEVCRVPRLKQLYLQKNSLSVIPNDFFQSLPNLTWLDLRFNRIRALPSGIGSHRHLKTLLLERNPIKMLPIELGNVNTLKALNLRHCPLEFPPQLIVQKGLVAILTFLRICAAENAFPSNFTSKELSEVAVTRRPEPPGFPRERTHEEDAASWEPVETCKEKAPFFPPVEKLDLGDLRKPNNAPEDWPSEEEIRRFWKLRQEIVENENANVLPNQLLPVKLPPNLQAALKPQMKDHPKSRYPASGAPSSSRATLPDLSSSKTTVQAKRVEERRIAALRELREKQMLLDQRRRDKLILQEWREQTWRMKMRMKKEELRRLQPLRRSLAASQIPFAMDLSNTEKTPVNPLGRGRPSKEKASQANKALRRPAWRKRSSSSSSKHRREKKHIGAAAPQEELQAATQDLEVADNLQDEVRRLKLALKRDEQFAVFTGNLSLHSQPQNIFFNMK